MQPNAVAMAQLCTCFGFQTQLAASSPLFLILLCCAALLFCLPVVIYVVPWLCVGVSHRLAVQNMGAEVGLVKGMQRQREGQWWDRDREKGQVKINRSSVHLNLCSSYSSYTYLFVSSLRLLHPHSSPPSLFSPHCATRPTSCRPAGAGGAAEIRSKPAIASCELRARLRSPRSERCGKTRAPFASRNT